MLFTFVAIILAGLSCSVFFFWIFNEMILQFNVEVEKVVVIVLNLSFFFPLSIQ